MTFFMPRELSLGSKILLIITEIKSFFFFKLVLKL